MDIINLSPINVTVLNSDLTFAYAVIFEPLYMLNGQALTFVEEDCHERTDYSENLL